MAGDVFDKGDPKKLFKLLNKLATGSYGTVFKVRMDMLRKSDIAQAQNKKSNDTVALKVIALEEVALLLLFKSNYLWRTTRSMSFCQRYQ